MQKASIVTLGCKVNQYESQTMQSTLQRNGYTIVGEEAYADLVIINSCTVTNFSDRKARQLVRKATKSNPEAKVIVTGCYAESSKTTIQQIPGVSLVFGNKEKENLIEHLHSLDLPTLTQTSPKAFCDEVSDEKSQLQSSTPGQRTRALLKVQDGCNAFCSFCIIPYVRGKMTSRPLKDIHAEATHFAATGFKEIVLTGIHLGSYGNDVRRTISLLDILASVNSIDGIERIRIGSLEPMDFSLDMVDSFSGYHKLMPHFHLPLQSGDDSTLERMRRRYTTEHYRNLVKRIRKNFSNATITSDVMVGFPGETDKNFSNSLKFVKEMKFSQLHVFRYSPRQGTPAATFPNQIPGDVAAQRSKAMSQTAAETGQAYRKSRLGKKAKVLIERSREANGLLSGYSENYLRVTVDVPERFIGNIVEVKLKTVENDYMTSELLLTPEQTAATKHLRLVS